MTEEDTIRALRRTPFEEMRLIVRQANKTGMSKRFVAKLLTEGGWVVREYNTKVLSQYHERRI